MKKSKVTCALSAVALVSGLGVFGFAGNTWATTCPVAESLEVEGQVSNESELRYAMLGNNDVSEIKIANDFTITCDTYPDTIKKDFTLDLNGNTITSQFGWAFDIETSGKTLTIKDTSEGANGTYIFPEGGFWVDAGANLTIESGNIQSINGGRRAILFNGGGKLTINGGNISTTPSKTSDGNGRSVMVYNSSFEMNDGTVSVAKAEGGQNGVGVFYIQNSNVLINNGEILASEGTAFRAINDSQIVFKKGSISGGDEVVRLEGSSFDMQGGEIYATGIAVYTSKEAEFAMSDGVVVSENSYALAGNGSVDSEGEPLHGDTVWYLDGGTITSRAITAIYQSQVGDTYLGEGLQVVGEKSGIEIRAGDLTIDGATITVAGDVVYGVEANGNGMTTTGAAIAVAQHTTRKPINVNIKRGTFIGPVAFSEANPQNNSTEDIAKINLNIAGGVFSGSVVSEDFEKESFVTGGDFVDMAAATDGTEVVINGAVVSDGVKKLEVSEVEKNTLALFGGGTLVLARDIKLTDKDGEVKVETSDGVNLTVSLAISDEEYAALMDYDKVQVAYFDDEGKEANRIDAELKGNSTDGYYVEFTTTHLSTYGVVGVNEPEEETDEEVVAEADSPETGTMTAAGASASVAAMAAAVTVGVLTSIVSFAYLVRRKN